MKRSGKQVMGKTQSLERDTDRLSSGQIVMSGNIFTLVQRVNKKTIIYMRDYCTKELPYSCGVEICKGVQYEIGTFYCNYTGWK